MASKFKVGNLVSTHGKARPTLGVVRDVRRVGPGKYLALIEPVSGAYARWVGTLNCRIAQIR